MLQIGPALFYYKSGQTLLQIGTASLLQTEASVVTNWGSYCKLGQPSLQNRAGITNWGKMYCNKLGEVLQISAIITNWDVTIFMPHQGNFLGSFYMLFIIKIKIGVNLNKLQKLSSHSVPWKIRKTFQSCVRQDAKVALIQSNHISLIEMILQVYLNFFNKLWIISNSKKKLFFINCLANASLSNDKNSGFLRAVTQ